MSDQLKAIQRKVGVSADGVYGPATEHAIAVALDCVVGQQQRTLHDPAAFFYGVRAITGSLDQTQVDTINDLLTRAAHWSTGWLAYGFATAWHEARLKPIEEYGKGKGKFYAQPGARSNKTIGPLYCGMAPYGRGLVQLTWVDNYEWADRALALNGSLLANFDRALDPDIAAAILVKGMETGAFTGKKLADYITSEVGTHAEFTNARRIINGTDKADQIATYADKFGRALSDGGWA